MRNLVPLNCFVGEPVNRPLCTLYDRYQRCGITPCGDGRGIVEIHEIPYRAGLEVRIRSEFGVRTLSLNSHVRPVSLNDLKNHEYNLHWCWAKDDLPRKLAHGETCAVLGNAMCWKEIDRWPSVEIDTQWRSTPLVFWAKILNGVFGTYDFLPRSTYELGGMPCDELETKEESNIRFEYLENLGAKPSDEAYYASNSYEVGGEGKEEVRECDDGYRMGEGRRNQIRLGCPSGGPSPLGGDSSEAVESAVHQMGEGGRGQLILECLGGGAPLCI